MQRMIFRLPLFQGPAPDYIVPLLAMQAVNKNKCSIEGKRDEFCLYQENNLNVN